ncbi:tRNA preQ1(34) S-adenosylmethionine ribosyltransferase-isomerase QueA [Buchnera aphidicola]|uniref:tRNA preQ1(34) S-adenosylmethionine ribosyltransferase-isomerase QueA n=1 Tax=Buchnera aphidicola TaxID=9 RepID=UPI0034647624
MLLKYFSFHVPKSLISFYPHNIRTRSRLLSINGQTGKITHGIFSDIVHKFKTGDVLVLNDTKVIPARLFGYVSFKSKKIEFLIQKIIDQKYILVSTNDYKSISIGDLILFKKDIEITGRVVSFKNNCFLILFSYFGSIFDLLNKIGYIPLPPYIKRNLQSLDDYAYQNVYSKKLGSIAAPTAGLHFDQDLLHTIINKGVKICFITLHIGSSTFKLVHSEDISKHVMHEEYMEISFDTVNLIHEEKKKGNRIIAVGTSTLRALESAKWFVLNNPISSISLNTNIFIIPGYRHKIVDILITNFHFPKSTLIMLVSSFLGYQYTMYAYKVAIKNKYRFFSYGDAMFITKNYKAPFEKILHIENKINNF